MAAGPSITGIEGWRVALLLVAFIVITLTFEGCLEYVEKRLKKRKGLLIAFRALKNELLFLGLMSLLLSVTQNYLARICIEHTDGSSYYKYKKKYALTDHCEKGKEPLWPVSVQHETHYFIFAVAATHIFYCAVTIALTLHKVGKWRKWEDAALEEAKSSSGDVKVMQETVSRSLIRSMCTSALATMAGHRSALDLVAHVKALVMSLTAQFRVSVSQPMYHNVRLLFIEKMGLTYDFDYHELVTSGMESQLAHAVHASWPLWLIAVIFLVLPTNSYVPFWSYILVICLMLVVGAKLVSVTALLGMQVAIKYGDSVLFGRMDTDPKALKRTAPARRRMSLSQLADALVDPADGGDGGLAAADGGAGVGGGADGGGGGATASAGGAHVLDEALPADAGGAEVAAQVAVITALTSRQEALNLLRTLAAMPLLPEALPPQPKVEPSEPRPEPSEVRPEASTPGTELLTPRPGPEASTPGAEPSQPTAAGGSRASTPKLLPSPSLLLGIAPPRWGLPPPQFPGPEPAPALPGQAPESPAAAGTGVVVAVAAAAAVPAADVSKKEETRSDVAITVVSDDVSTGPAAGAGQAAAPGSRPTSARPPTAGAVPASVPAAAAAAAGSRPSSAARPFSAAPVPGDMIISPSALPAPAFGVSPPPPSSVLSGSIRPSTAQASGGLSSSFRPSTEQAPGGLSGSIRPSTAQASGGLSGSIRPSTAQTPGGLSGSIRPSTPQAPAAVLNASIRPGTPRTPGDGMVRPVSALRPPPGRPGSKSLLAVATATNWANASRRGGGSRANAGLMLCGVATSRVTMALGQMEETLALAASDAAMNAAQAEAAAAAAAAAGASLAAATSAGDANTAAAAAGSGSRPTTPATGAAAAASSPRATGVGLRALMASLRFSKAARESEDPRRPLLDASSGGPPASDRPPLEQAPSQSHPQLMMTGRLGATLVPAPAAPVPAAAGAGAAPAAVAAPTIEPGAAALQAAAAAAAFARSAQIWYKKPVRKCYSARQLMCGRKLGEDHDADLTRTMVGRPAGARQTMAQDNNATIALGGPHANRAGPRPGGAQDDSGLGLTMDMLPASNFRGGGGGGGGGARAAQHAPLIPLLPKFPKLFGGLMKGKKDKKDAESPQPSPTPPAAAAATEAPPTPTPPPPPAQGAAAPPSPPPPPPPGCTSVFALYQMPQPLPATQQAADGTTSLVGGLDLSSVYESLAGLLPPCAPQAPGSSPSRPSTPPPAVVAAVTPAVAAVDVGGGAPPAAAEPAELNDRADGGERGVTPPASPAALPPPPVVSPVLSAGTSETLRPATPTLLVRYDTPGERSLLRIVRIGGSGKWMTEDEAACLIVPGSIDLDQNTTTTGGGGATTASDADTSRTEGLHQAGTDTVAEVADLATLDGETSYGASAAAAAGDGRTAFNSSMAALLEAPSLEAPLPVPSGAELPQRSFSSVFSMQGHNGMDGVQSVRWSHGQALGEPGLRTDGSGGGIRAAASVEGSGELTVTAPGAAVGSVFTGDGDGGGDGYAGGVPGFVSYGSGGGGEAGPDLRPGRGASRQSSMAATPHLEWEGTAAPAGSRPVSAVSVAAATTTRGLAEMEATVEYGSGDGDYDAVAAAGSGLYGSGGAAPSWRLNSDRAATTAAAEEFEATAGGVPPREPPALPPPSSGTTTTEIEVEPEREADLDFGRPASVAAAAAAPAMLGYDDVLDGNFSGFGGGGGGGVEDLNRTAPRIGAGTLELPLLAPPQPAPPRSASGRSDAEGLEPSQSGLASRPESRSDLVAASEPRPGSGLDSRPGSQQDSNLGSRRGSRPVSCSHQPPMRASRAAFGSTASLVSLDPWAAADAGGSAAAATATSAPSDPPSRQGSTRGALEPVRTLGSASSSSSSSSSGGGSRQPSRAGTPPDGGGAGTAPMPAPPAPPLPPPPAPPPPEHLRLHILDEQTSIEVLQAAGLNQYEGPGARPAECGGRWALPVAGQVPWGAAGAGGRSRDHAEHSRSSIGECIVERFDAGGPPSPVSVRSWDDPVNARPVCEGSDGVGRDDVLAPPRRRSGALAAAPSGGRRDSGAATPAAANAAAAATPAEETFNVAGVVASAAWLGITAEKRRQTAEAEAAEAAADGRLSGVQEQEASGHYRHHHHHHHHRHHSHNQHQLFGGHHSDSDSEYGHPGCWPSVLPKPWQGRVVPLPAPVKSLADNVSAGMDKAKVAISSAAESVREKLMGSGHIQRKMSDHWLERVRNVLEAHKGFENMDASQFFWFHNPKVIAHLFNWAYYENSLSIALLVFSLILGYQNEWVFKGVPYWSVPVLLVADFLILVHSCLYVLPLYALITPVGSHCPKDVLKRALKAGVYTRQAAMIAKARHLQLKAREAIVKEPHHGFLHRITHRWNHPEAADGDTKLAGAAGAPLPMAAAAVQAFARAGGINPALSPGRIGALSPGAPAAFSPGQGALSPAAGGVYSPGGGPYGPGQTDTFGRRIKFPDERYDSAGETLSPGNGAPRASEGLEALSPGGGNPRANLPGAAGALNGSSDGAEGGMSQGARAAASVRDLEAAGSATPRATWAAASAAGDGEPTPPPPPAPPAEEVKTAKSMTLPAPIDSVPFKDENFDEYNGALRSSTAGSGGAKAAGSVRTSTAGSGGYVTPIGVIVPSPALSGGSRNGSHLSMAAAATTSAAMDLEGPSSGSGAGTAAAGLTAPPRAATPDAPPAAAHAPAAAASLTPVRAPPPRPPPRRGPIPVPPLPPPAPPVAAATASRDADFAAPQPASAAAAAPPAVKRPPSDAAIAAVAGASAVASASATAAPKAAKPAPRPAPIHPAAAGAGTGAGAANGTTTAAAPEGPGGSEPKPRPAPVAPGAAPHRVAKPANPAGAAGASGAATAAGTAAAPPAPAPAAVTPAAAATGGRGGPGRGAAGRTGAGGRGGAAAAAAERGAAILRAAAAAAAGPQPHPTAAAGGHPPAGAAAAGAGAGAATAQHPAAAAAKPRAAAAGGKAPAAGHPPAAAHPPAGARPPAGAHPPAAAHPPAGAHPPGPAHNQRRAGEGGSGASPFAAESTAPPLGGAGATHGRHAPPPLLEEESSAKSLEMSFERGAKPGRRRSGDSDSSLGSSLSRSGSITALMAGMYRGAMTHLTAAEQREAVEETRRMGRAAGRGRGRGRGRGGLDMTLVPDR